MALKSATLLKVDLARGNEMTKFWADSEEREGAAGSSKSAWGLSELGGKGAA